MCGIAGFIDEGISLSDGKRLIADMLSEIQHRGPENSASWSHNAVTLGHNRLKIIDLRDIANQPLQYLNLVIVFNGEVYNYLEIREELLRNNYTFYTESDTEVICAAYDLWGELCVSRFIGMWAFAIWDSKRGKLFCSRDRFGIKPFYYFTHGSSLYFASEYKSFKRINKFSREPNVDQLIRGIVMAWATYGDETFYKHLKTLEAGHNLVWESGKTKIYRYWDINLESKSLVDVNQKDLFKNFYGLFRESISLHSRSDVPNGMCLSGGIDSSAIASMYSTVFPNLPIKAFTVFYEGKFGVDERPFVYEVQKKYPNIQPFYYSPKSDAIASEFHNLAYHADVPVSGSSFLSQFFLMGLAKKNGVTVVLDGQGSDEYLGGYLHGFYRLIANKLRHGELSESVGTFSALSKREGLSARAQFQFWAKTLASCFANEEQIYKMEFWNERKHYHTLPKVNFTTNTFNKFDNYLYHQLLSNTLPTLLHFEDRSSMAFSLESRVPFLNHKLVEFVFSLPDGIKINSRAETKYILREAMKEILPEAIYSRKDKKGFVTPGEQLWLKDPLKFLLDIDYGLLDFMKKDSIKKEIEKYKNGDTKNAVKVWRIATTSYWMKNFM